MNALIAPLKEMAEYDEITGILKKGGAVSLTGCVDSGKLHMMYALGDGYKCKLIVTFSDMRAKEIQEDFKLYDRNASYYPSKDIIFYQADVHGNQLTKERIKVLRKIVEGRACTVITTFDSLMTPQIPLEQFKASIIHIAKRKEVNESWLANKLVAMGYEKNYQVEAPGQFSIRGGIIDIFDLTEENPYRIELWGEEVDSIRSFDVLSQRSIEKLESISIYPATDIVLTKEELSKGLAKIEADSKKQAKKLREQFLTEEASRVKKTFQTLKEEVLEFQSMVNLESYIKYFYEEVTSFVSLFPMDKTIVFFDELERIKEHSEAVEFEFRESMIHRVEKGYLLPGQMDLLYSKQEVVARTRKFACVAMATLYDKHSFLPIDKQFDIVERNGVSYNRSFELLVKDLQKYKKEKYRVLLLVGSRTRAKRIANDLRERELAAFYSEDPMREVQPSEVMLYYGHVNKGFEYPLLRFVVISESDIFGGEKKKKRKKPTYSGQKINHFSELKVGDYVVHEKYGLGVYQGIDKIEVKEIVKDYLKISYRDGGSLYILPSDFDIIQKYGGANGKKPKLNKLGTKEWTNTKQKVQSAVSEVAKDLVALYAIRQEKAGYQFEPDTVWQREFEEMFPYDETDDQLHAIIDTKKDMQSKKIMDRLICGDVGYGKTEIAIRAAFKAVQDGKQVAFLVPTTILAQQHYNNFVQRMKDFPVQIEMMSRFRTPAQQKQTIQGLKKGMVDIVIGTHRILSKDIEFKDLGLLIIDEEQRFGVTHKEKIKKVKEDVDVLTLSATPIPRTLHMSLAGIRDMSVLEEAPNERMPIQTYVMEYNEEMIREAITRELARNGQVYYVYNRVQTIDDMAAKIQKLLPDAVVAVAHGQMGERQMERVMYEFIEGEIDVLVSTTIVETGLDISNVNTIIIHDSDKFGLSQLYQLRGRVGRSNRNSYAFLMYKKDKMLKEVAEKRLQAIREFTDLGSGFKIAMRDLEIRGAGNLLGEKQHGHMEAVGYDLYCKMLNEAVKQVKGIGNPLEEINTAVELEVDAFIPPSYIVNEVQKLEIYKRIATIETQGECDEMKEELLDRFGEIPKSVDNLLRIEMVRMLARKLYLVEVKGELGEISFKFRPDAKIKGENIPMLLQVYGKQLDFSAKGDPSFIYRYKREGMIERDVEQLLTLTETVLGDMINLLL